MSNPDGHCSTRKKKEKTEKALIKATFEIQVTART